MVYLEDNTLTSLKRTLKLLFLVCGVDCERTDNNATSTLPVRRAGVRVLVYRGGNSTGLAGVDSDWVRVQLVHTYCWVQLPNTISCEKPVQLYKETRTIKNVLS